MVGEFAIKADKIKISRESDLVQPYVSDKFGWDDDVTMDFDIHSSNEVLHICGSNDWGYLMADALIPLLKYSAKIKNDVKDRIISDDVVDVIGLGMNEYRALDIAHRLNNCGEPIHDLFGVPIVQLRQDNGMKIYFSNKTVNFSSAKVTGEVPFY